MPEYFLILVGIVVVTVGLQKWFGVRLYKSWRHLIVFNVVNVFLATVWDQWAIFRGHWGFNEEYLLGLKIGFMPVEEFLFVLVLSYFALTLFKITEKRL